MMPTSGRGRLNQNETNTEGFVKQMLQKQAQKHLLLCHIKTKKWTQGVLEVQGKLRMS